MKAPESVLACPACGARLKKSRAGLDCSDCGASYPTVAGVPILVPDPGRYLGRYRDAILATLAETGHHKAVAALLEWAEPGREQERFKDDFLADELTGVRSGDALFDAFLAAPSLPALLAARVPPGRVLELGCGAGSQSLTGEVLRTDLNFRAALRAGGAVVDAERMMLLPGSVDVVVAANLLDLLDQPEAMLQAVADGLDEGGRLVACAPGEIEELPGFRITEALSGVPWVRAHGPEEFQVFFCTLVVAEPA